METRHCSGLRGPIGSKKAKNETFWQICQIFVISSLSFSEMSSLSIMGSLCCKPHVFNISCLEYFEKTPHSVLVQMNFE